MCKYCERRTDVKLGWNQPELPWHHNQDITKNISGNMIHTDDTVGVINDYQTGWRWHNLHPNQILSGMWTKTWTIVDIVANW